MEVQNIISEFSLKLFKGLEDTAKSLEDTQKTIK